MTIGIGPSGAFLHIIGIGVGIGISIGVGQWIHAIDPNQHAHRKSKGLLLKTLVKHGLNYLKAVFIPV